MKLASSHFPIIFQTSALRSTNSLEIIRQTPKYPTKKNKVTFPRATRSLFLQMESSVVDISDIISPYSCEIFESSVIKCHLVLQLYKKGII